MEYLKGGELYDYWHRFENRIIPEREACEIMLQLAQGLEYCHSKKIIHRDIKFQNILLQDEITTLPSGNDISSIKIKIVDFGIFGSNRGTSSEKSTAGSLKYMAPELLSGRTHSTPKIDVWSMGCMLYAMVTGEYPFEANEREELKRQILFKETKVRTKQT
jgi:serine/threonine protein kinase